jgi:type VII secretion protein EccE
VPLPTRAQLVLLELAAAAVVGGLAARGAWLAAGMATGALAAALALVPVRRRWLFQLVGSWLRLTVRRLRGQQALVDFRVVTVPAGASLPTDTAAIRAGTTWSVPLEVLGGGVFDRDLGEAVALLTRLLRVEDVPLASARVLSVTTAGARPAYGTGGQLVPGAGVATRYCVLTLDAARATDAVVARGGTEAAVHNILRRCVLRAEQTLTASGVAVRRLDSAQLTALLHAFVLPETPAGSAPPSVQESWSDIRVAGTWSMTYLVSGAGPDLITRLAQLSGSLGLPAVTTALLVAPGPRGDAGAEVRILLRLSGVEGTVDPAAGARIAVYARSLGLTLHRLDGEQATLLRATTPLGVAVAPGVRRAA